MSAFSNGRDGLSSCCTLAMASQYCPFALNLHWAVCTSVPLHCTALYALYSLHCTFAHPIKLHCPICTESESEIYSSVHALLCPNLKSEICSSVHSVLCLTRCSECTGSSQYRTQYWEKHKGLHEQH